MLRSFPHYQQLDSMDCGPSCLRMIAKFYGRVYSIQNLREKAFITREGVSMLGISEAAEAIGFRTQGVRITVEELEKECPLPCILHWNQWHFVVCYKIRKGKFYIADPAAGLITYTREEFKTFAAIAMAHYALASGDKGYAEKAVNLFKQVLHYKNTPGLLEPKFREGLVAKGHSFCMILIDTAARIREAINDPILTQQIDDSIAELRRDFMHPEFKAILETVGPNGEFIDSIAGRTINPGHSIETAWFILEEAKYRGWDPQLKEMGLQILNWSWDWGWDKTYGGINYFKDCKNFPPQEYWHDMKFWWPQCEAVIATLYAYQATGDAKYLEMHKLINDYTFNHLPDKEYGEWYGYLHFDGSLSQSAKGNLFKGPFHIPRMLLKCSLLCDEILSK